MVITLWRFTTRWPWTNDTKKNQQQQQQERWQWQKKILSSLKIVILTHSETCDMKQFIKDESVRHLLTMSPDEMLNLYT